LLKFNRIFKKALIIFICVGIACSSLNGQVPNTCLNSDFSLGNFTDWEGYYGTFSNPSATNGFAYKRHTIIKAPGSFDPRTCDGLFTLPPGADYCAKLGNENIGGEAEQLRYKISVTNETNLFIYKYAVVLQNPVHEPQQQPSFTIEVADDSGNLIDPLCGYYYVYAHQGLPTWHTCSFTGEQVIWKDWTTVGIDLSPFIEQTITIVFTTKDCSLNQHYGYAYISAYCSQLKIVYGFCLNDSVATVTAPPGFSYLWGTGDTTQVVIVPHPKYGMIDSCILTSVNGCKVTIKGTFTPTLVNADFDFVPACFGTPVAFSDSSKLNQNYISNWLWDFGDGSPEVDSVPNPLHSYDRSGIFNATLKVSSMDGCTDSISKTLRVAEVPIADFAPDNNCGNKTTQDTIYFDGQVHIKVREGCDHYAWSTGDSTWSIPGTNEGWYKVTIENNKVCTVTDSVMLLYCFVPMRIPNAFSPNNDDKNDKFRVIAQAEKVSSFVMSVYNAWGEQVFKTSDIKQGWDGTIKGEPAPQGLYAYMIQFVHPAGIPENKRGMVLLLRME
jgi:gliding motility-associated-like protein